MAKRKREAKTFITPQDPEGINPLGNEVVHLPHIKSGNRDSYENTALEKEIKKFNQLIQGIHDYENQRNILRTKEDEYHQLWHTKLAPVIREKAEVLLQFVVLIDELSYTTKLTKNQRRSLVMIVLSWLDEILASGSANEEAKALHIKYLNQNVELMSNQDKLDLADELAAQGKQVDFDNFSIEDIWEQEGNGKAYSEEEPVEEEPWTSRKKRSAKSDDAAMLDTKRLFKELAKIIHPDREQDDLIKSEKEALMKELTAAKQKNDLFSLLLIKAKSHRLFQSTALEATDLAQMKRYNRVLTKRLEETKASYLQENFNNLSIDDNGYLSLHNHNNPGKQIKQRMNELKNQLAMLQHDFRYLNQTGDLKSWINAVVG